MIPVTKMMMHGWLHAIDANLRRGHPVGRETGDGRGATLVVTYAGLLVIGIEPMVVKTVALISEQALARSRRIRQPNVWAPNRLY